MNSEKEGHRRRCGERRRNLRSGARPARLRRHRARRHQAELRRRARHSTSTRQAPCSATSRTWSASTTGYDETAGSDVVVITAGLPRKPGMSRDDLVTTNEAIVGSRSRRRSSSGRRSRSSSSSRIRSTRCATSRRRSRSSRTSASSGWREFSTRRGSSASIAWETGMSVKDVTAMVLGGHGDQMVPVVSATTVGGVPLEQLATRGRRSRRWSSEPAKVGGGGRQPPRHLGVVRAGRSRRADGRRDLPRREARAALHGVPRGRVRHRRALHGRSRQARRRRRRGDREAQADRRREEDAEGVRGGGARGRRRPRERPSSSRPARSRGRRPQAPRLCTS